MLGAVQKKNDGRDDTEDVDGGLGAALKYGAGVTEAEELRLGSS